MNQQREQAIAAYHESPNHCRECEKPILVQGDQKVSDVRRKVFCNLSCSAQHHQREKRKKRGAG